MLVEAPLVVRGLGLEVGLGADMGAGDGRIDAGHSPHRGGGELPGRRPPRKGGPAARAQKLLTSSEIPITRESTSKARFTSRLPLAMARWAPK